MKAPEPEVDQVELQKGKGKVIEEADEVEDEQDDEIQVDQPGQEPEDVDEEIFEENHDPDDNA